MILIDYVLIKILLDEMRLDASKVILNPGSSFLLLDCILLDVVSFYKVVNVLDTAAADGKAGSRIINRQVILALYLYLPLAEAALLSEFIVICLNVSPLYIRIKNATIGINDTTIGQNVKGCSCRLIFLFSIARALQL